MLGWNNSRLPGIISESEHIKARCVSKFSPTKTNVSDVITFVHCNLSTIYMYLLLHDDDKSEIEEDLCSYIIENIYLSSISTYFEPGNIIFTKEIRYKNEIGLDYTEKDVILFRDSMMDITNHHAYTNMTIFY